MNTINIVVIYNIVFDIKIVDMIYNKRLLLISTRLLVINRQVQRYRNQNVAA